MRDLNRELAELYWRLVRQSHAGTPEEKRIVRKSLKELSAILHKRKVSVQYLNDVGLEMQSNDEI